MLGGCFKVGQNIIAEYLYHHGQLKTQDLNSFFRRRFLFYPSIAYFNFRFSNDIGGVGSGEDGCQPVRLDGSFHRR
jgi:hypothetical protein